MRRAVRILLLTTNRPITGDPASLESAQQLVRARNQPAISDILLAGFPPDLAAAAKGSPE